MKQGNSIIVEYAMKFEELVKFCPHYNSAVAEGSNCIKFESELRPKIKQGIGYQKILQFFMLLNKCRIYDEANRAQSAHCKSFSEKKGNNQNHGNHMVLQLTKESRRLIRRLYVGRR